MKRQVPLKNKCPLLIGSGRVARHLNHFFELKNQPLLNWSRNFQDLNSFKFNNENIRLKKCLEKCSRVYLAISDDELISFIQSLNDLLKTIKLKLPIVHFSGSMSIENVFSAHPLMTFTNELKSLKFYESIPFVVEENLNNLGLPEILPGFKNSWTFVSSIQKPLYHAACVISGNFTNILWREVYKIFDNQLHIDPDFLKPYLIETLENILKSPMDSLSGPIQRNDTKVIEKNLSALSILGLDQIYSDFLKVQQKHVADLAEVSK